MRKQKRHTIRMYPDGVASELKRLDDEGAEDANAVGN